MATLSELRGSAPQTSLKRGSTARSLGGTKVVATQAATPPRGSNISQFAGKVKAVAGQTASLALDAGLATTGFIKNSAVDIKNDAVLWARTPYDAVNLTRTNMRVSQQNKDLDAKQEQIVRDYKSGRLSKDNYSQSLRDLSKSYQDLSKESEQVNAAATGVDRASALGWTAINILSGGEGVVAKSALKQGGKVVVKKGFEKAVDDAVVNVEKTIMRVPAGKELLAHNAAKVTAREQQKLAGETMEQWMARSGKQVTIGLLIKRPIFYQQNVGFANEAYKSILDGNYQDALTPSAWLGVQMIGGGPLIAGAKFIKGKVGALAKGRGSFIDELSRKTDTDLATHILNNPEAERTWRIAQHTNMTASNGKATDAAEAFLQPYIQAGVDLKSVTAEELTDGMARWAQADELRVKRLSAGIIKGVDPSEVDKYAVVRWDTVMKNGLTNELSQLANGSIDLAQREAMLAKLTEISERPGVGWGNNELLLNRLQNIIANAADTREIAVAIKQIDTASVALKGMPRKVAKEFADLGYTLAAPFGGNRITRIDYDNVGETTQKIVTGAVDNNPQIFDPTISPQPVLKAISGALNKSGLSPEGNAQIGQKKLSEALIGNLGELDVAKPVGLTGVGGDFTNGGRAILSQLQSFVEAKKGAFALNKISGGKSAVTDIRQLTNDEISTALGITKGQAKQVSKSIRDAYTKVPLEFRGLGDKIVDYAIAAPLSPMRYYQRVQSAFRYTYNPFFRLQEQVETQILASMDANKFIWAHRGLDDTVRRLEQSGVLEGNVFGAGADDAVIGRISANLTKFQKRNLAGLAETIAKGQGKTVEEVLTTNPEQIEDALRIIVQYPKQGGLASPLARTINLAFFPMRYNAKVSLIAAEKLASMPPSIQFATIQGIYKAKEWLKTDEGIAWQAEYSDAIQVWSWASPVGNITQFYKLLAGNVSSPGDLGLLGGLPFGFISQMLDSQGIINLNKPYVNPKTGDVIPDYIPVTTRAKSAVALQDFIGTMFSFPGRTLGLPGKEENLRKAVGLFIDTNGKDFEKRLNMDELTPLQQNMVRVLKGDTSEETLNSLYYSPAEGQFDYYTIPPITLPIRPLAPATKPNVQRRTDLPTKAELRAAKKAASNRDANGKKIKPLPQPITR